MRRALLLGVVLLLGCPATGGLPCGYYNQTLLIIRTGTSGGPAPAHEVTCHVRELAVSEDPEAPPVPDEERYPDRIWADCIDDDCTVWRCMGLEGRVTVTANAPSGAQGTAQVDVSPRVCAAEEPPEIAITMGG